MKQLIMDGFGMKILDGQQLLDFMEIIEDRHGQNATIIIFQLPVADWYEVIKGNTTAAVHTSERFELQGTSMRQRNNSKSVEIKENDKFCIAIKIKEQKSELISSFWVGGYHPFSTHKNKSN